MEIGRTSVVPWLGSAALLAAVVVGIVAMLVVGGDAASQGRACVAPAAPGGMT